MDRKQIKVDAKDAIRGSNWILFSVAMIIWSCILGLLCTVYGILFGVVAAVAKAIGIAAVGVILYAILGIFGIILLIGFYGTIMVSTYKNALELWDGMSVDLFQISKYTKYIINNAGCMWSLTWRMMIPIPFLNIYLALRCCMNMFVKADNPYMKAKFCAKRSSQLTKGHVWDLVVFSLSYIPWFILGSFTCGLAMFYVMPYMCTALAGVYRTYKDEFEQYVVQTGTEALSR